MTCLGISHLIQKLFLSYFVNVKSALRLVLYGTLFLNKEKKYSYFKRKCLTFYNNPVNTIIMVLMSNAEHSNILGPSLYYLLTKYIAHVNYDTR